MLGYLMVLLIGLGIFAFAVLFGPSMLRLASGRRHRRR